MGILRVLSLFDGLAGARAALEKLGVRVEYYACEIDEYAIRIALKNFPDTRQIGDVLQFFTEPENIRTSKLQNLDRLPRDIDLLIGGFPCQGLSVANNNGKGLDDPRSFLFYAFLRILDHYCKTQKKPFYFVGENVESMKTPDFVAITNALGVEPVMLDAGLVSAQRRKRYFWTNIPNVKKPKLVPSRVFPDNKIGLVIADILEPDAERRIIEIPSEKLIRTKYGVRWNGYNTNNGNQSQKAVGINNKGFVVDAGTGGKYPYRIVNKKQGKPQGQSAQSIALKSDALLTGLSQNKALIVKDNNSQTNRAISSSEKFPTLTAERPEQKAKITNNSFHGLQGRQTVSVATKYPPQDANLGKRPTKILKDHNSEQYRAFSTESKHGTLVAARLTSKTNIVFEDLQIEQLTWTELERLAGLPDGYTDLGAEHNRVEHRGRAIGNGFQIDIVAHLLSFMLSKPEPLERAKKRLRGEQGKLFEL